MWDWLLLEVSGLQVSCNISFFKIEETGFTGYLDNSCTSSIKGISCYGDLLVLILQAQPT